ncbi:MAG: 2-amino-4-hydroxy-6-hydroxymethyldihydropteridine diphosphokinase [bacterium]|nr:2-amino-4-hydroxy-6-hydroxymethyldihydropteridine diphosphokinase [bacterium]
MAETMNKAETRNSNMPIVYLSLGSNEGDRNKNIGQAVELLNQHPEIQVKRKSSLHETLPVGYLDQPCFLNSAVEIETGLPPLELLDILKLIEKQVGRKEEGIRWGPRVIDLDIILYNSLVMETPRLTIPHPRALERAFVLLPLAELVPKMLYPGLGKTIEELALSS